MNNIDKIRASIRKDFKENTFIKGDFETVESTSKRFRLDATNFYSKESNCDLTKVEIYNQNLNVKLFDFFINDSHFFYSWETTSNIEYLISSEDVFGGQTIVDLTNGHIAGYSPDKDGFIWTDFHLSPNGKILATIGCYWACPYVIKLFDFSNPMNLPLRKVKEIELLGNDEIIVGWLDNDILKMKTKSETEVNREIKINGS